jgi:hypothetical protein
VKLIRQIEFWLVTLFLVATGIAEYRHASDRHGEILRYQNRLTDPAEFEQYTISVDWVLNDFGGRMLQLVGLYVAWLLLHFVVDFRRKNLFADARTWLVIAGALITLAGGVIGYQALFRSGHLVQTKITPQPPPVDSTARARLDSVLVATAINPATVGTVTEKHIIVQTAGRTSLSPLGYFLLLLFVLAGYEALAQFVYLLIDLLQRSGALRRWQLPVEIGISFLIWGAALLVLGVSGLLRLNHQPIRTLLVVGVPVWYGGLLILQYSLLPRFREKILPSFFLFAVLAAPVVCALGTVVAVLMGAEVVFTTFMAFYSVSLVAVFPMAVHQFRRKQQTVALETNLGQTGAELAGLKAQLNPHFLFNALNTLYASALQEGGERTAEGIQRLGDLMRFMLHDNARDRIELSREIEYLRQYVELQRLRIGEAETVDIRLNLPEAVCPNQVPPMLLIPFVENAFKHGISLRQPSWIDVELTCEPGRVIVRVNNSKHVRGVENPEAESSGIGLENVRKRLNLLYPNRHTLKIHETSREFSVGLELQT